VFQKLSNFWAGPFRLRKNKHYSPNLEEFDRRSKDELIEMRKKEPGIFSID